MKMCIPVLLTLAAGSIATQRQDAHSITLRDIGLHDPTTQAFVLSLRDLDDDHVSHHLRARGLDGTELKVRALAEAVTTRSQALLERRMALTSALAGRGGSGGGGGGGSKPTKPPKDQTPASGGGSGGAPELKGLSPDAQKAQKQCQSAYQSQGDCGAMKGAFAEMGCTLGSAHSFKPCENKELQKGLSDNWCATHKGDQFYKKFCGGK